MAPVVVYSTSHCGYCYRARALLDGLGIAYESIDVTHDHAARRWLVEATKQRTVPQIFIGGESIGGFDELAALHRRGLLAPRVERARRQAAAASTSAAPSTSVVPTEKVEPHGT